MRFSVIPSIFLALLLGCAPFKVAAEADDANGTRGHPRSLRHPLGVNGAKMHRERTHYDHVTKAEKSGHVVDRASYVNHHPNPRSFPSTHTHVTPRHGNPRPRTTPLSFSFDKVMLPLTKDKFDVVAHAAFLMELVYYDLDKIAGAGAIGYTDSSGTDQMLSQVKDDFCFISWRGTDVADDWTQNFNAGAKTVNGCDVHEGFWQSYAGEGEFLQIIEDFIQSSECSDKQLIFTGHSQGGAAAGVAHIAHSSHNPLSITFGQPPFLYDYDCNKIDEDHVWRIINSENYDGGTFYYDYLVYDIVPNFEVHDYDFLDMIGPHIGASIILPPGEFDGSMVPATASVAYFGPEKPSLPDLGIGTGDVSGFAHTTALYLPKMETLAAMVPVGGELDTTGFVDGSLCFFDSECHSSDCDDTTNVCK